MFKQLEINPNFIYNEGGNYSIDISPINEDIVICTNNTCNIYSKEKKNVKKCKKKSYNKKPKLPYLVFILHNIKKTK